MIHLENEARYVIQVKNPHAEVTENPSSKIGSSEGQRADFPDDLRRNFAGKFLSFGWLCCLCV